MHGFIHNDVPSALAGSCGFPTDGEHLLVSMASQAAIEPGHVQCRPHWHALVGRPSGRAGLSAGRQGMAQGFLQDDLRANFGVGNSCHVVGSEWNIAAV